MQSFHQKISTVAAVALTIGFVAPAHGEFEVIEAYTVSSGGLTRDSLSDANIAQTNRTRAPASTTRRLRRAEADPKDFVASRSHRRHRETRQKRSQIAATHTSKHRNPVAGFVYWWNGWVIRTFHTKFGTVLLGTVGAKS